MAYKEMDKNRAIVYISAIFTYGIVTLVRTVYLDARPTRINIGLPAKKSDEITE